MDKIFLQIVEQASGVRSHLEDGRQAVLFPGQPLDPPVRPCFARELTALSISERMDSILWINKFPMSFARTDLYA